MKNKTEITWYKALVLITAALAIGFGITNMVYFNEIRTKGNCGPVSTGTATTMIWLNLILAIVAAIVFFWSLFRLIFTGYEEDVTTNSYNIHTHIHPEPDVLPNSGILNYNMSPSSDILYSSNPLTSSANDIFSSTEAPPFEKITL